MIKLAVLAISGLLAATAPAGAHTVATPPTAFGDQEAAVLKGFFEKLNAAQQSDNAEVPDLADIVRDVIVETARGAAGQETEEGDGDDESGEAKKAKKNKNKAKNKGRGNGLPPGLAKQLANNGSLPPGLQKRLRENGALPPGLNAAPLPADLEAALHELPAGQQRVIADNDVLIVDTVTGVVLDSLPDAIPPELVPILRSLPDIIDATRQSN